MYGLTKLVAREELRVEPIELANQKFERIIR